MSGLRVGVVDGGQLAGAIDSSESVAVVDDLSASDELDLVVLDGENELVELARSRVEIPALVVGDVEGISSVSSEDLHATLKRIRDVDVPTERHPIVSVTGTFGAVHALFDVALMAAEPARISEFSVIGDSKHVAQLRADGVVASTPAGSHGYNQRAGGPVVSTGAEVASVVPIAPFSTSAGHWVLPIDAIELTVERDEAPVELLVDGRRERVIDTSDSIELSVVGTLETYVVPERVGSHSR